MVEDTMTTKLKTELTEKSVTQMIEAARRDPRKFGDLYLLYAQPVYRYLLSRIRNIPEAEDATTQTFLAALEQIKKYKHDGYFASWLFSIARNKAMDYFRKQRKETSLNETELISTDINLLTQVIKNERITALAELINKLPEEERELIHLRYVGELNFAEIGQLLGQKEDTVKKSLHRLLARLKAQLEDSYD
jgi:RNA polymerase sigma-70 factor, ECF subfamily